MKKMDLADRVEHCQFLGREFMLYLWWKSEVTGGTFALEGFGEALAARGYAVGARAL